MPLHNLILKFISLRGISRKSLAKMSWIKSSNLHNFYKMLRGERKIPVKYLRPICDALCIDRRSFIASMRESKYSEAEIKAAFNK